MRVLRLLCVVPVLLLQGCWFVFIPGSVVGAVTDKITGAEGDHCVTREAKIGDVVRLANGRAYLVESLSGRSSRCHEPELPIRAKLNPI